MVRSSILLALLFAMAPASALAAWSEPRALTPSGEHHLGGFAANDRGEAILSWTRRVDSTHVPTEAMRRSADGTWGPIQTLTAPNQSASWAAATIDPRGNAAVAWDYAGPSGNIYGTTFDVGAPPTSFKLSSGRSCSSQNVAMLSDARGAQTVFWDECGDSLWAVDRPPGGSFGPLQAVPLASSTDRHAVTYAKAANGTTVAVWLDYVGVYATVRDPGGSFRSVTLTSKNDPNALRPEPTLTAGISQPMIAINDRGDAIIGWVEAIDDYQRQYAMAAYKPAGGDWEAPVRLTGQPTYTTTPAVTIDAGGTATVVWTNGDDRTFAADGRDRSFGPTEVVAERGHCGLSAATDALGTTWLGWRRYDTVCQGGGIGHVEIASRPEGGKWTGDVESLADSPWIGGVGLVAQHGGVLAVWDQDDPHDSRIFEAHTTTSATPPPGQPPTATAAAPQSAGPAPSAPTTADGASTSTSARPAQRSIALTLPAARVSLRGVLRRGLPVTATCPLRAGRRVLATRTVHLSAGQRLTLHLRVGRRATRHRRWQLSVVASAHGVRRSARRTITVGR